MTGISRSSPFRSCSAWDAVMTVHLPREECEVEAVEAQHEQRERDPEGQVAAEGDGVLPVAEAAALLPEDDPRRGRREDRAAAGTDPAPERPGGRMAGIGLRERFGNRRRPRGRLGE